MQLFCLASLFSATRFLCTGDEDYGLRTKDYGLRRQLLHYGSQYPVNSLT